MSETQMPYGDEIENWIKNQNKKAIGALTPVFIKALTLATEPFFRRDLGERYAASASSAGFIWVLAFIGSSMTGSLVSSIFEGIGWYELARLTHGCATGLVLTVLLFGAFIYFTHENTQRLQQIRNEGKNYHSMSRGVSRWADDPFIEIPITAGISIILLLFAPITGIIFIVSRFLCLQAVAKQQAALYDRYMDAMDAKIEAEQLETSILGETPPEITYLYKPLPKNLKDDIRKNIAAAAVGKPVKLMAQGPKLS